MRYGYVSHVHIDVVSAITSNTHQNLQIKIQPSLERIQEVLGGYNDHPQAPNLVPICATIPADLLTPSAAYLKISARAKTQLSFLFESAATSETIGRYSFVGADPRHVLKTGDGHGPVTDPVPPLAAELSKFREADIPGLNLPTMNGGAVGYVGYDCVQYFEPRTRRPMKDVLGVPESLFMFFDTIVAFDHFFQVIKVISYLHVSPPASSPPPFSSSPNDETPSKASLSDEYARASCILQSYVDTLQSPETPLPPQPPITPNQSYTSNIGRQGYENHVHTLKSHITRGDIIQAVPSQRFARPTSLHPFNIYRHLRTVNPSPYLFYISCSSASNDPSNPSPPDIALVGASPELLVQADPTTKRIITHPIAGTVKRGSTPAEDAQLASTLRESLKDRAEHVMLVDLARNDINRVCSPLTTRVDRLMVVEKFSHVQHLVSQVSGVLRKGMSRFDAFRSIFPAGTVSGAPKVRAMELIAELEGEKRGVYAGAVGYFGYDNVKVIPSSSSPSSGGDISGNEEPKMTEESPENKAMEERGGLVTTPSADGKTFVQLEEGAMDTCIALRTMLIKDGVAYLQAGGGIVFDSVPFDEWEETMNKLGANIACIEGAEERYGGVSDGGNEGSGSGNGKKGEGFVARAVREAKEEIASEEERRVDDVGMKGDEVQIGGAE
ncbi:hypothetical protein MMC25_002767 [Agyrium rufum]|nr:hypothetical protein [Agyrium rufum]